MLCGGVRWGVSGYASCRAGWMHGCPGFVRVAGLGRRAVRTTARRGCSGRVGLRGDGQGRGAMRRMPRCPCLWGPSVAWPRGWLLRQAVLGRAGRRPGREGTRGSGERGEGRVGVSAGPALSGRKCLRGRPVEGGFCTCLTARRGGLFVWADAVLGAGGAVKQPVEVTPVPGHRRGHGALYGALDRGGRYVVRRSRPRRDGCRPPAGGAGRGGAGKEPLPASTRARDQPCGCGEQLWRRRGCGDVGRRRSSGG